MNKKTKELTPEQRSVFKGTLLFGLWARFIILIGLCVFLVTDIYNNYGLYGSNVLITRILLVLVILFFTLRYFSMSQASKDMSRGVWACLAIFTLLGIAFWFISRGHVDPRLIQSIK